MINLYEIIYTKKNGVRKISRIIALSPEAAIKFITNENNGFVEMESITDLTDMFVGYNWASMLKDEG